MANKVVPVMSQSESAPPPPDPQTAPVLVTLPPASTVRHRSPVPDKDRMVIRVVETLVDEILGTAIETVPVADVKVMPASSDSPEIVNLDDDTLVDDTRSVDICPAK